MAKSVEEAIQQIRKFHRLGCKLQNGRYKRGEESIETKALAKRVTVEFARKAGQFARLYSKEKRDELCRMIEMHDLARKSKQQKSKKTSRPWFFGRSHVFYLLRVRDRDRDKIQKLSIQEEWSISRFQIEIGKRYGIRRDGGRDHDVPPSATVGLTQLEKMCEQWRRWEIAFSQMHSKQEVAELALKIETVTKSILALHRIVALKLEADAKADADLAVGKKTSSVNASVDADANANEYRLRREFRPKNKAAASK